MNGAKPLRSGNSRSGGKENTQISRSDSRSSARGGLHNALWALNGKKE